METTKSNSYKSASAKQVNKKNRQIRLAASLRQNLQKRKDQAKKRIIK